MKLTKLSNGDHKFKSRLILPLLFVLISTGIAVVVGMFIGPWGVSIGLFCGWGISIATQILYLRTKEQESEPQETQETEPHISDELIIKQIFDSHITDDTTVSEVFDTLSEKQKNVVYFMIGEALGESSHDKCIRM